MFSNNFFLLSSVDSGKGTLGPQYAYINLFRKWRRCIDASGRIVGTLLRELSKAFDCVNHDLIIAKQETYGVGENSLILIQDFFPKDPQRVKVGSSLSERMEINLGVPQASMRGPIVFNVFITDFLLIKKQANICNSLSDGLYIHA